jgi:hypothetical protein
LYFASFAGYVFFSVLVKIACSSSIGFDLSTRIESMDSTRNELRERALKAERDRLRQERLKREHVHFEIIHVQFSSSYLIMLYLKLVDQFKRFQKDEVARKEKELEQLSHEMQKNKEVFKQKLLSPSSVIFQTS